jgi:hypothetical protein
MLLFPVGPTMSEVHELQVNVKDFRIGDLLRRGTFGNIHLVKEKTNGGIHAVKIINKFQPNVQKFVSDM